jgi:hypothetical protein
MIAHWRIKHPLPFPLPKLIKNGRVLTWNWVCDEFGDGFQRNEVDAKMPNKLINAADVLLVWFSCKKCLEHPFTLCSLNNVSNLGQDHDALTHNDSLAFTVQDFLN